MARTSSPAGNGAAFTRSVPATLAGANGANATNATNATNGSSAS